MEPEALTFDIPSNLIVPVDTVDVRLDPDPHPFEMANAAAIEENWRAETDANPALFDGTVVLLSSLVYAGGRFEGRCHAVRYATFMHWRRERANTSAGHVFAHAMLVSRDNALVAIRMAANTVNAGRVYFAAGSFEPVDFADGAADVDFNMVREVAEETGLDISSIPRGERYYALSTDRGTVLFRRYFLPEDADEIARRIETFVASEPEPEISEPVIIREADDLPDGLMPHMKPLVEWHFSGKN
jgi:8-oxo-dGTP pyrophosphatase MutT (NUDIX family)